MPMRTVLLYIMMVAPWSAKLVVSRSRSVICPVHLLLLLILSGAEFNNQHKLESSWCGGNFVPETCAWCKCARLQVMSINMLVLISR